MGRLTQHRQPPKLKLSSDDLGHRPPGPFLLPVFSSQLSEHSSFANLIEAGKGGLGGWQCRSRVPKMHTVAHRLSPSLQLLSGVQGFCPIMEARLGGADAHRISSSSTPRRHSGTRQTEPNPQFRAMSAHLIDPLRRNAPREMRSQLQALAGRQTSSVVALAPTLSAVLLLDASPCWGPCWVVGLLLQRWNRAVWAVWWCLGAVAGNLGGQFGGIWLADFPSPPASALVRIRRTAPLSFRPHIRLFANSALNRSRQKFPQIRSTCRTRKALVCV